MNNKNGNIVRGIKKALDGFKETLIKETSFKVMLIIGFIVASLVFYFPTSRIEKIVLFLIIFAVLVLELINSTVERIMDFLGPDQDEKVRIIKDLMAAIVLLAGLAAIIVGIIIFYPYILGFWFKKF